MDLKRPVKYRGLVLNSAAGGPGGNNPIDGIRLTRAQYSDVSVHGYVEKRSLDDGFDASDVFLGMRDISLQGEVFARSKAALFDYLDNLRLKFTPTDAYNESPSKQGYLPLAFEQPTLLTTYWPSGFVPRVIYARPSMQPSYAIDVRAIKGRENDGYVVPFDARLQAKDPRFYLPDDIEVFCSGTGTTGTLVNRGNYPAPLNFVLQRSASETAEATFTFVGMGTNMTVTIPAGTQTRTLRVDSIKKVVTLTVGANETLRMDLIDFTADTTWPKVPPTPEGDSPAGWEWTASPAISNSRFFYNEAWV